MILKIMKASHEMDGKMGDGGGEDFGRVYSCGLKMWNSSESVSAKLTKDC